MTGIQNPEPAWLREKLPVNKSSQNLVSLLEGVDCLIKDSDPHIALKVCALTPEEIVQNLLNKTYETNSSHLIGFRVFPGNGCGEAFFGLNTAMSS